MKTRKEELESMIQDQQKYMERAKKERNGLIMLTSGLNSIAQGFSLLASGVDLLTENFRTEQMEKHRKELARMMNELKTITDKQETDEPAN